MKDICVVTGGGSGMGLETAKILGKEQKIILMGRTVSKLQDAINELKALGIEAEAYPGDASDRESVKKLAAYAASQGNVKTVVHAAGVSPHMTDAKKIFEINAIGTINVDEEFAEVMGEGSCILNVSSMSAYILPDSMIPKHLFKLALEDVTVFQDEIYKVISAMPEDRQTSMSYPISKNFVIWYTAREAIKYGKKGIRVVSIAPGTFSTPMGEIEGEEAASYALRGAMGRVGRPEEIAKMMAFMVSDECSYLCGVDVLYDGGTIAAMKAMMEDRTQQA